MSEPTVDDLSPLFRSLRDATDTAVWRSTVRTMRRPSVIQGPEDVMALVDDIAPRYKVDPALVKAVMGLESGGNPNVPPSRKGAQGLMQLMPGTAQRFGVQDIKDPVQNLTGGIKYLAHLQDLFPGRVDLQLAGYHAGEGAVKSAGNAIPNTHDGNMSTPQYVQTILSKYRPGQPMAYTSKAASQGGVPPVIPVDDVQAALSMETSPMFQAMRTATTPQADLVPDATEGAPTPGEALQTAVGGAVDSLTAPGRAYLAQPQPEQPTLPSPVQAVLPGLSTALGSLWDFLQLPSPSRGQAYLDQQQDAQPLLPTPGEALRAQVGSTGAEPTDEELNFRRLPGGGYVVGMPGPESPPGAVPPSTRVRPPDAKPSLSEAEPTRSLGFLGSSAVSTVSNMVRGVGAWLATQTAGQGGDPLAVAGLRASQQGLEAVAQVLDAGSGAMAPRLSQGEQPAFWDKLISAIGTSLPSQVFGLVTGGGGMMAALGSAVTEALGEAGELYRHLHPLVGDDEASARAMKAFGANVVVVALTDRLGIFGDEARMLRRALNGVLTNGVQEAVQYDIQRRQMWVPSGHAAADALKQQGWMEQDGRLVMPFDPKEAGEAALIGMLIGGPTAAAVALVEKQEVGPVERVLEALPEPGMGPLPGGILASQRGAIRLPSGPPLRAGAEGLTPERYRTPSGEWRVPLRDLPSQELTLLDFIRQQGGVKLEGEELQGEFTALLSRKETGLGRLQNNASGLTVQQMAETAAEYGFIPTADKASLLQALDQAVTQGQPVYSMYATGHIPLLDDPHVQASYQAVLDAVDAMRPRTEEAVAGVRHRREVHQEAALLIETGQFTLDDVRELFPNTALNDTMASALLQTMNTLGENLATAAQAYLDSGARVGSREEASLQSVMALFAELDPTRLGVSAAQSRALGILNDPLSGYTQFLNGLHQVLLQSPERTMESVAKKIVGLGQQAAGREALRQRLIEHEAAIAQRMREEPRGPITPPTPRTPGTFELQTDWVADLEVQQLADLQAHMARQGFYAPRITGQFEQLGLGEILPPEAVQHELISERDILTDRAAAEAAREELRALFRVQDAAKAEQVARAQQALAALHQWFRAQEVARLPERLAEVLRPWEHRQEQLQLFQVMTQAARPGFQDYFLELWYNAMLSSPSTHIANAISNTLVTAWAVPERWIAAEVYGRVMGDGVAPGEATAMLYGLVHGVQDAWTVAVRSFQQSAPQSGLGREYAREPVVTATNMGLDPTSKFGRVVDFWFEYIGLPYAPSGGRLPSRLLMASDEFFKMLNYRAELNALAYREATRQGYEGTAWAEHVARVVSSPQLSHLQQAASDFAVLQTFQQVIDPQARTLGGAVQSISNWTIAAPGGLGDIPVGKVIVPFVQTPVNIARWAMERTPAGVLFSSMQADLDAGGARADLASAKITLGTLTMLGMAGLALSGRLTGRGPEDPDLREVWLQSHQPYSLRLPGGIWLALDRLEPVGMLATTVGDIVQIAGEASIPAYQRAIGAPLYAFLQNIGNKTYMQGLSDFFDAASPRPWMDEKQYGANVMRFLGRRLGGLAQPSSLVAATARAIDPAEKDMREWIDALYARVPGWSGFGRSGVPSRRALGGEKIIRGWGFSPEFLANTVRAYFPLKLSDTKLFPADAEILANKMDLSLPPRSLATRAMRPGQFATTENVDISEYPTLRLSPAQYERFVVLAAGNIAEARKLGVTIPRDTLANVVEGLSDLFAAKPSAKVMDLGEFLDWMVRQPEYEEQTTGTGGGREDFFKTVVAAYRNLGKELLLAQDDELRQQYEQTQIQHVLKKIREPERKEAQDLMLEQFRQAMPRTREELGLPAGIGVR